MEKTHLYIYSLVFPLSFVLTIISFVFCILAEFKKSKLEDVKLDGEMCELPGSEAFGFGIAALICFLIAQIIGNLIIFITFCQNSGERKPSCQAKRPTIASVLLVISWISFGTSVTLMSTATSLNKKQPYGKGWLDGECYIVKDGVFIGAAILLLVSFGCTLASALVTFRKKFQVSTAEKATFSSRIK